MVNKWYFELKMFVWKKQFNTPLKFTSFLLNWYCAIPYGILTPTIKSPTKICHQPRICRFNKLLGRKQGWNVNIGKHRFDLATTLRLLLGIKDMTICRREKKKKRHMTLAPSMGKMQPCQKDWSKKKGL